MICMSSSDVMDTVQLIDIRIMYMSNTFLNQFKWDKQVQVHIIHLGQFGQIFS